VSSEVVRTRELQVQLRKLVPEALDSISSGMIHKWYLRCMRVLEAHKSGEKYGAKEFKDKYTKGGG
jgi:hypothetical protein